MRARVTVAKGIAFALAVFLGMPLCARASEPVMKTLSAHMVSVAADGSAIEVDFKHPATGKVVRMRFVADGQTGLSGIGKLRDLRAGQVVNIDYVEDPKGRLCIRRIARVKLSGPPPGLENFRGL